MEAAKRLTGAERKTMYFLFVTSKDAEDDWECVSDYDTKSEVNDELARRDICNPNGALVIEGKEKKLVPAHLVLEA